MKRNSYNQSQEKRIELVGGPLCGSHVKATESQLKPGKMISIACHLKKNDKIDRSAYHREAVYVISEQSKGLFLHYISKNI